MSSLPEVGPTLGDALLVASELVTNAVRHSQGTERDTLQVQVDRTDDQLRVSVQDPGGADCEARITKPAKPASGGMGLRIVDELSSRWGSERREGYTVWAEVPLVGCAAVA
jgi:serine/threonine-protein kinase RsbW